MKFKANEPPREFEVGREHKIRVRDCAHIGLDPEEQVTFVTESGAEFDVMRKAWGYYAMPSLNGRLTQFGLRAVLVKSPGSRYYIFLVERGKEDEFRRYIDLEEHVVIAWLDSDERLREAEEKLHADG